MEWETCSKCDLCDWRVSAVLGSGSQDCRIMFIEGIPGPEENESGIPLQSNHAAYFYETLAKAKVPVDDVFFTYTVACAPLERKPFLGELDECRPRVYEDILYADPDIIVLMGDLPVKQLLSIKKPVSKMQLRTFLLTVPGEVEVQYPCIITYSLTDILKTPSKKRNQPWHFFYRAVLMAKKTSEVSRGIL